MLDKGTSGCKPCHKIHATRQNSILSPIYRCLRIHILDGPVQPLLVFCLRDNWQYDVWNQQQGSIFSLLLVALCSVAMFSSVLLSSIQFAIKMATELTFERRGNRSVQQAFMTSLVTIVVLWTQYVLWIMTECQWQYCITVYNSRKTESLNNFGSGTLLCKT